MYPQSLQTHSPSQYIAAFASSSAFAAALFLLPNTMFKLDGLATDFDTVVDNRGPVNAVENPAVLRITKIARRDLITAFIFENNMFLYF